MEIGTNVLEALKDLQKPIIIGVSGFGGSGKSSFSKELGNKLHIPVVGIDSFQKTNKHAEYSLWEIMDFTRLEQEVIIPFIKEERVIKYGHFNSPTNSIYKTVEFENNGLLIIEGVGLFRPELLKYFTYKIWVDLPVDEAIRRGKKRDREEHGDPKDEFWDSIWKENDQQYVETYKPKENADLVVSNI